VRSAPKDCRDVLVGQGSNGQSISGSATQLQLKGDDPATAAKYYRHHHR
jgi:hypothetical protein